MQRKLFIGLWLLLWLCPSAWANLTAVGDPVDPHGFPLFYDDGSTQLELCLEGDGLTGPCVFDPPAAGNVFSQAAGFGNEAFYLLADAQARPLVAAGKAVLVMGVEAAFGGNAAIADGNQITFARVRIRVDVAQAGNYRITYPYGVLEFPGVTVAGGINYTEDIGSASPLKPALAFAGALQGKIGPFLTWDTFDPNLTPGDPAIDPDLEFGDGNLYVGNPAIPHTVTGSTTGDNFFRIEMEDPANPGTFIILSETDLFTVAGKILNPATPAVLHVFPDPPVQNLFAVGPVNREAPFPDPASGNPHPGGLAAIPESPLDLLGPIDYPAGTGYPIGFPYYYQDTPDDIAAIVAGGGAPTDAAPGLQLTICPGTDPMCISVPPDPANPQSAALNVGDESFWWSADAIIDAATPGNTFGIDGRLVMGLEGAFGGLGTVNEGDQISFTRIRIRVDVPVAGTYTITHPYGQITFENVPAGVKAINYTEDLGNINNTAPDTAFTGALYGNFNPFLTWDTFDATLLPGDPLIDPDLEVGNGVLYIGNPAIAHAVTGSPTGNNQFRVQGPGGIDTFTDLFTVQGKVYDPATFVPVTAPGAPVAVADVVTVDGGVTTSIDVLANDTFTAPVTIELLTPAATFGPFNGQATVNGGVIDYTPAAGFAGADSFTYRITDGAALVSNNATVSITVDSLGLDRAQFDSRTLLWEIRGSGTTPGATLTIHEGPDLTGAVVGSVLVDAAGIWRLRTRAVTATTATSISIVSSTGKELLDQPLRIR